MMFDGVDRNDRTRMNRCTSLGPYKPPAGLLFFFFFFYLIFFVFFFLFIFASAEWRHPVGAVPSETHGSVNWWRRGGPTQSPPRPLIILKKKTCIFVQSCIYMYLYKWVCYSFYFSCYLDPGVVKVFFFLLKFCCLWLEIARYTA